jgi:BirA family biotin operon repressor/biotin-[acetyl-CoA-carboxylase] ligase
MKLLSDKSFIPLDKQKIQQLLNAHSFSHQVNLHLFPTLDSTNRFLKEYPPCPSIEVCCAETQTQGRGRFGKHWYSPFGENIYCSTRWHLPCDLSKLSGLSLIASLAIMTTLRDFSVQKDIRIKWPNDLLWQDRKLCGSLIELVNANPHSTDVIIGVGLNVNSETQYHTIPDKPWCSLSEIMKKKFDRNALIAQLVWHLDQHLNLCIEHGFTKFMQPWKEHDYLRGKAITVSHSNATLNGKCMGIDNLGHLLLMDHDGHLHQLAAGDTSIIPTEKG